MVQLRYASGEGAIYEWQVDPTTRQPIIPRSEKRELIKILQDERYTLVFWNAKFDIFMLESVGIHVPLFNKDGTRHIEETSWMARYCNNLEFNYQLKFIANKYVNITKDDESDLADAVKKARTIAKKLGWMIATKESHGDKDTFKADYWIPKALHDNLAEVNKLDDQVYQEAILKKATIWYEKYQSWEIAGKGRKPAFNMPKRKDKYGPLVEAIDPDACVTYGMLDSDRTLDLYSMYKDGMDEYNLWEAYNNEMNLLPTVMAMEREGVRIDKRRMKRVVNQCLKDSEESIVRLREATGNPDFNPNSSAQVANLVYNILGLEVLKRTPITKKGGGGNPGTDAEALMPYAHDHSLIRDVFVYKSSTKAMSTFFSKYEKLSTVGPNNEMIVHPGYNQMGTLTHRFTCKTPNLQQVSSPESSNSRSKEFLVDIRQVFIPMPGCGWYMPDYSQVEVIIFADMYNVESMLEAVRSGVDIHEATAERIWGGKDNELGILAAMDIIGTTDYVLVNSELHKYNYKITKLESAYGKKNYRKLAKTVTFCKTYGGGPRVLMSWLGIDMTTAKHLMKVYDQAFPDMQEAMAIVEAQGKADGYVMTPFGTRLAVDPWAVYKIINHTIQHSAALLLKRGMRRCVNYLDELDIGARLALTVHDENIFEFRNETATKERLDKLSEIMSDHGGMFSVPTPVDMDYAPVRWSEKDKIAA